MYVYKQIFLLVSTQLKLMYLLDYIHMDLPQMMHMEI